MADRAELSCVSTPRVSRALSPAHAKDLARIAAAFALAAFALAGCNANHAVNSSSQQNLARIYPNYSASNPIQYAQTSGFYGGR
jgi:hypothetical protein